MLDKLFFDENCPIYNVEQTNIKDRWNRLENKNYKIIANEFNISLLSAKKYINMTLKEIEKLDDITEYKKRKTNLDNYISFKIYINH